HDFAAGRRAVHDPDRRRPDRGGGAPAGERAEARSAPARGVAGATGHRARLHDHGLLIVGAVVDHELDLVLADLDRIVVGEQLFLDGLAVDVGAVGAVEVFDEDVLPDHLQHRVLAADGEVVDDDVVVGATAERGLVLRELNFLDHDPVERYDQFAHALRPRVSLSLYDSPPGLSGRRRRRKLQRRNGHHDRAAPAGPLTRTSTTEILSFPPASLAASMSALAASGSNSQLCNSWPMVSSSSMSERP